MKPGKPLKPTKAAHTPKTSLGMGDYYGRGVKQPVGKGAGIANVSKKKLGTPPRSLA